MGGRFSIEAIFKATDRFTRPMMKMAAGVERMSRKARMGVDTLNKGLDRTIGLMKGLGGTAVGAGVTAGAALLNIGKAGADFETAISAVGAVSLMTRDQIRDLEKEAIRLGSVTKFSAAEVAQGMELMGRAGFTNEETLAGISGILAAAAAEGAELAVTASHVSNVLKGMGLAASESGRVADVLTLASARTNSSISSLGDSMANVSSTARQFKIPMEEVVASVALLQDLGLDASEAGSAVNTMLTQMAAPSKEAAAQMKQLGISFQDAKGNMLPLQQVFAQFEKAAKKSGGNMAQVAFFANLVGLRGQKAALNLKDMFESGKFSALAKELENAEGSAEKMAALRLDNLNGDIEQLGGAVDALKIRLFQTQSGPLRGIVKGMTEWVEKNGQLIESKAVEYINKIVDSKDDILKWGERIAYAGGAIVALKVATVGAEGALIAFSVASKGAGLVTSAFTGVVTLSTTAIGGRTAAMWLSNAAIHAGTFATTSFSVATGVSTAATWAKNAAVGAGTALLAAYRAGTLGALVADTAHAAATWVKNAAVGAGNLVMAIAAVAHGNFAASALGAAAANGSLAASFAPFMVAAGAALAMVGALLAAYDQWKKLKAEMGGSFEGLLSGDVFGAVDERMNEQARAEAAARAEQPTVQSRGTDPTTHAEVAIVDHTGKAKITKPPKGNGMSLTLQPSGAP